jgi:SIT4-associating protein SAP185/190
MDYRSWCMQGWITPHPALARQPARNAAPVPPPIPGVTTPGTPPVVTSVLGFGGYANVSTIDTILDKPDVTLEELLDESDLIQELKQHNTKLIEYLREDKILERLLEYVVAPKPETAAPEETSSEERPEDEESKGKGRSKSRDTLDNVDEDEKEKKRNKYAYVAAEILSSDNWSICEALMENQPLLRKFWDFLKLPPPLDPLQASYFTKVNEALLDKKTEEMLELFKSLEGAVKNMLRHVDSPMVMDLLLKIISLEKAEGGQGIVDVCFAQTISTVLLTDHSGSIRRISCQFFSLSSLPNILGPHKLQQATF